MKNLLTNPNFKLLVETMDLEQPKHYLAISDYEFVDGKIVINEVEVLDQAANVLKTADLSRLINHMHEYPIAFRNHDK